MSGYHWLTVGQDLLSLYQARVKGNVSISSCFFIFIPVPLSSLSLSFISSTISSISFLLFSGKRHKITYNVVKRSQSINKYPFSSSQACFWYSMFYFDGLLYLNSYSKLELKDFR